MDSNKVRSVKWAQSFSGASDVTAVLQGAEAIEQFLIATGHSLETEQDAALCAASMVSIRSAGREVPDWQTIVADARRVFDHLVGVTASAQKSAAGVVEPRSEVA